MFKNIQDLTKQAIDKANEATTSGLNVTGNLTESAIVLAIDKTIDTLQIAAKRIQEKKLSAQTVNLGASVNIAMIQITIEMVVSTDNSEVITNTTVNTIPQLKSAFQDTTSEETQV